MSEAFGPYPGGIRKSERFVVCKTQSGRTLIASKPVLDLSRGRNASQKSLQETVRQAVTYAEFAWDQPIYECKAMGTAFSAYNLAVADYLRKPQILEIDIRGWIAGIGQAIRIKARDNFMVLSVRLVIRDEEFVWEAGEATQSESDSLLWTYITKTPVVREPGLLLDAYAYDLPGNVGEYHLELR